METLHRFIHLIGALRLEIVNRLQDAHRRTTMNIGFIHQRLVARERHHPGTQLHIVRSQGDQLFRQHLFQFRQRFGNHRELCLISGHSPIMR